MFDNREKLENFAIFGPGGHNFELGEKLTESFVIILDELSNAFSIFFLYDKYEPR